MRIYKIVTPDLRSMSLINKLTVRYRVGEFVQGKYPLFAFATIQAAFDYCGSDGLNRHIYAADGEGYHGFLADRLDLCADLADFYTFWAAFDPIDYPKYPYHLQLYKTPPGTVLFDRIKLIERVYNDYVF